MSKITRRVRVALGERLRPVGELVFETDGRRETSMFRYSGEWIADPEAFALAPGMPLSGSPFYAAASGSDRRSALLGPFRDGAPEAWGRGLIRRALPGPLTESDYLLAADDETRQGALRYLDEAGTPLARSRPPVAGREQLAELRRLAGDDRGLTPKEWERWLGSASSLGGARPKASLRDEDGALVIAKFTSLRDTKPIEKVEAATLGLARAAAVDAARARVVFGDTDRPVALVERFDRTPTDRIHYLSAQSFIGADAATGGFYTDIADGLRAFAEGPREQLAELYRRILFTILVSNNDDHLKNHGLLHAGGGRWALAPAFDINPEPQRHRHLETGISELSGNEASIEAALEAAPFFDLRRDAAAAMLARMVQTVADEWRARLRAAGLSSPEVAEYEPAFEHEQTRIARRLTRSF